MCDRSERRLLAEERESETYMMLYRQVEADMAAQYQLDFGPTYRQKFPFQPDADVIDKIVSKLMRSTWE